MIDKQKGACYHERKRAERGFYMGETVNKVTIITSKRMLEKLRDSMRKTNITGIKAAMVKGCTLSPDKAPKDETEFLQKVRIEMVVSDEQLSSFLNIIHQMFDIEGKNDM